MQAERLDTVAAVFHQALDRPPDEREGFVTAACGADETLRREVGSLLDAHVAAERLTGLTSVSLRVEPSEAAEGPPPDDRRFGSYVAIRELARGGMGRVFLGSRVDTTFDRLVAIKVLPAELDEGRLARFHREREVLAALEHPNVARLYDAGATRDGSPYFVMELVDGLPIDRYCDRHRLSVEERVDLFREVCAAVAYAHRNLIVHRDLKPSNILVTADGVPKLLDFGIAKPLRPGDPALTATRQPMPMTPGFASPEQLRGGAITTGTDVYALGVLLYLLLAGRMPHSRAFEERLRELLEGRLPLQPSAGSGEARSPTRDAARIAADRRTRPARLRRQLAGNLDAIVLQALRPDPAQRYASVEQLAADLERHTRQLPVSARGGGIGYRLSRFVRRHRLGVAVAASLLASLGGYAATLGVLNQRVVRERDQAQLERRRADEVKHFLIELFEGSETPTAGGEGLSARELLDWGVRRLEDPDVVEPETRGDVLAAIGSAYHRLGLYRQASTQYEGALTALRAAHGERHSEVAAAQANLALSLRLLGDYPAARAAAEASMELRREILPPDHPDLAHGFTVLAELARIGGRLDEAEGFLRQALAISERNGGGELFARQLNELGKVLRRRGELEEAQEVFEKALPILRGILGPEHSATLGVVHNLSTVARDRGEMEKAEGMLREVLAIRRRTLEPGHPLLAFTLTHLGYALGAGGFFPEAEAFVDEALEVRRRAHGDEHVSVAVTLNTLGQVAEWRGAWKRAEASYGRALEIFRQTFPAGSAHTATALAGLGRLAVRRGDHGGAEPLLREAYEFRRDRFVPGQPQRTSSADDLGACLVALGRRQEAGELLRAEERALAERSGELAAAGAAKIAARLRQLEEVP